MFCVCNGKPRHHTAQSMAATVVAFEIQGDATPLSFRCVGEPEITLRVIKRHFPLAGDWHFRAKIVENNAHYYWQDLVNEDQVVAHTGSRPIHLKALPLSVPTSKENEQDAWIVEENVDYERAFKLIGTGTTPTPAPAASSIDEKFAKLGNSMFSAFKSVVKNVS